MDIRKVQISEVKVWDKNPRNIKTGDFERLKRQIQELGVYKPLICVRENGKYITLGGNMRLRALMALNIKEVEISIVKARDEATKIKYALSDNDRAGEYDEQALAELAFPHLEEINLEDYKVDIGQPISLKDVIEDYAPDLDEEDEIPEIDDSPAITKPGDLFTLGKHRLLCGDATKEKDVKRLMNGEKADMVFTDPPYNVALEYGEESNDDKDEIAYVSFSKAWFKLSPNLGIITPGWNNLRIWLNNFRPQALGIWIKSNAMTHGIVTQFNCWEPILFYGCKRQGRDSDVFNFPIGMQKEIGNHPCPKPLKLWNELIGFYSDENMKIHDPLTGSGTTIISCEKLNRICYSMEIEPKYCDVIIKRYANFTETSEEEIRKTRERFSDQASS